MAAVPTPKDRFTALDTLAVAREIRQLGRARVDKVFDLPGGGWAVALRAPGAGRRQLALVPARYAAIPSEEAPHSEELSAFARELRRLLSGAAIRAVVDPAGERLLEIQLERADDPEALTVALEIFGKGNLIVARGSRIVAVAESRRFAHRELRIGAEYSRPPIRIDPWTVGPTELEAELARSRTDLASTLAARLAYGGPVAEELVARCGLDGARPAASDAAGSAARIHMAVAALLREVGDSPRGWLYRREGSALDATPYASHRWAGVPGVDSEARASFSDAAAAYFRSLTVVPLTAEEQAANDRRRELERLLAQQEAAVEALARAAVDAQGSGEAILAHYADSERAIDLARSEGSSDSAEFDAELGGRRVRLRTDRTPRARAQELFDESKRLRAKLAGARTALAETTHRIAEAPVPTPSPATAEAAPARRRAPFWFERFRWFISSDGAIVIAGRDAPSNDLLVRRHLRPGDRYVHADLHGAASVVVKRPDRAGAEVGETTLREAGQFAVVYSKAWRAGLASASAFWVEPDQVSKAAPSGEFVARGAWAIQGTKHRMEDLPTEIALGTVVHEGATLWTAAPPSAVRARGTIRVVLVPGEERDRGATETGLARDLGLPRPRLQSLLPAGGLAVRRT